MDLPNEVQVRLTLHSVSIESPNDELKSVLSQIAGAAGLVDGVVQINCQVSRSFGGTPVGCNFGGIGSYTIYLKQRASRGFFHMNQKPFSDRAECCVELFEAGTVMQIEEAVDVGLWDAETAGKFGLANSGRAECPVQFHLGASWSAQMDLTVFLSPILSRGGKILFFLQVFAQHTEEEVLGHRHGLLLGLALGCSVIQVGECHDEATQLGVRFEQR